MHPHDSSEPSGLCAIVVFWSAALYACSLWARARGADPLEVIKSAYFYDARGGEHDPRVKPSPWLANVTEVACGAEKSTAEGLCEAVRRPPSCPSRLPPPVTPCEDPPGS